MCRYWKKLEKIQMNPFFMKFANLAFCKNFVDLIFVNLGSKNLWNLILRKIISLWYTSFLSTLCPLRKGLLQNTSKGHLICMSLKFFKVIFQGCITLPAKFRTIQSTRSNEIKQLNTKHRPKSFMNNYFTTISIH